ncbi:MAG TPA: 4,5-DOPA dioxygenase extradiol [Candidatus Baltobacteraceae bacterium]
MPAIFAGHGNPLNALASNDYTRAWRAMADAMPKPRAILSVSAHWYAPGVAVTSMERPRTIHDFGGFPPELFRFEYPAAGDPGLARRAAELLGASTRLDQAWGLDHGTWSVLCHMYPDADVPVVQLCIDEAQEPAFHYDLAKRLAPLREEGVLIFGSGNIVHNLHAYAWGRHPAEPFDWTLRFQERVRDLLVARDHDPLIDYESLGSDALLSVPTPDHYLPLLYVIATQDEDERVTFPAEGVDGGSISMLSVRIG